MLARAQMWSIFHAKLHQTLKNRQLLPPKTRVLIAVSGGQDSLCLARLILDLQPKWHWQIAIAHCDHRWPSDVGLAAHVGEIARHWGVDFYLERAAAAIERTEAAAREWRYGALIKILQTHDFNCLLTGHTLSDRAETLLYNLVRGAGMEGLSALSWERPLGDGVKLIRPLLNFSRDETLEFCRQFQLPIWQDVYNQDKKYARNRIRLELIPYLKAHFNPQIEEKLAQTAELLKGDRDYLEQQAEILFGQVTVESGRRMNRLLLRNHPLSLQRRAVRIFLAKMLPRQPNFAQIEAVVRLIHAPNRSKTPTLQGNLIAQVQREFIMIVNLGTI